MQVRRAINVTGIVQGVGFRPYIYRLAKEARLVGTVSNTAAGVAIEVQGSMRDVETFLGRLPEELPPLATITHMFVQDVPCDGDRTFVILPSRTGDNARVLVAPDVAVCDDCLRELFDPADRRYRYPFINCTNCGPRFTIVRQIPYDRARTSMSVFPLCPACQAEYANPADRRFHAQPNACWRCGPRVELWDASGDPVAARDPVRECAALLQAGNIVAVKGLGGFHLAGDATNVQAVERLRAGKRRFEKPFAVMVPDIAAVQRISLADEAACAALRGPQRPIVLLPRRLPSPIALQVAPGTHNLGIFLPYTPLHYLLFADGGFLALVMTSGNLSEEPIAIDNREAVERLRNVADYFLVHNRDILRRCDDSVVHRAAGRLRHLRRSRGFVPIPVALRAEVPAVLAVGGGMKNTVCLTRGSQAFLSQHIGDLENVESYRFFEEAVSHLEHILGTSPNAIAHDVHPGYFSTQWAVRQCGLPLVAVQHHHAHIASCMAENGLAGRVIGIALDGTGLGTDGAVWGGEVLVADEQDFERAAHFEYVPMPGGEAAIREPWRMAVSYLLHCLGEAAPSQPLPFVQRLDSPRLRVLRRMMETGVNAPPTSSCGRLFDAVAALIGMHSSVTFEGQAALELEMAASPDEDRAYPFELSEAGFPLQIRARPMFERLVEDLRAGVPTNLVSARFHNGLVDVLRRATLRIRERSGLNRVCLSGGCFQNALLLERLLAALQDEGFVVFTHAKIPANDGGLSLGQAFVAAHRLLGYPRAPS
jgi:hydrogenase maturation protein HypF